jgi:hypothetical protein
MRFQRLFVAAVTVAAVTACTGEKSGNPQSISLPPLAYVRYFNAMGDTLATDFRPIDQVTFSTPFLSTPYRGMGLGGYQGYATGARQIRVFPSSTDINTTQKFFVDTSLTLTAGTYYSIIHTGFARTGSTPKQGLWVLTDAFPAQGTGVALRIINTGVSLGNVDVYLTAAATDPLPTTPTFANVAFKTATAYSARATGPIVLRVYAAGTTTPALVTATMTAGTAGTTSADPLGGSGVAGTIATAMIYSPSVVGSVAQAAAAPTIVYWIDKQPPRTTSP